MAETIILIGGAPCTGKTTLAKEVAKKFNFPWISTDTIRTIMQATVNKGDLPALFTSMNISAEEFYIRYRNKNIWDIELAQSEGVQFGLTALIESDYPWTSFIIEGVAITPEFAKKMASRTKKKIIPIFMYDLNRERIKNIIYTRGLWSDAHEYPDYIKDLELEWVIDGNNWLKKEAEKYKYELFSFDNQDKVIPSISKLV